MCAPFRGGGRGPPPSYVPVTLLIVERTCCGQRYVIHGQFLIWKTFWKDRLHVFLNSCIFMRSICLLCMWWDRLHVFLNSCISMRSVCLLCMWWDRLHVFLNSCIFIRSVCLICMWWDRLHVYLNSCISIRSVCLICMWWDLYPEAPYYRRLIAPLIS